MYGQAVYQIEISTFTYYEDMEGEVYVKIRVVSYDFTTISADKYR